MSGGQDDTRRLAALAGLLRDLRLADLGKARQDRDRTLAEIAALQPRAAPEAGLVPAAAALAALRYDHWADLHRQRLNLDLARKQAAFLAAESAARQAFGRARVLEEMAKGPRGPGRA